MKIAGFYKVKFNVGGWDDFKKVDGKTVYIRQFNGGFNFSWDSGNYTYILYNKTMMTDNQLKEVLYVSC